MMAIRARNLFSNSFQPFLCCKVLEISMAAANSEIPTIDIQPWLDGSNPDGVVKIIRAACMTYGFFQLVGHGIPLA